MPYRLLTLGLLTAVIIVTAYWLWRDGSSEPVRVESAQELVATTEQIGEGVDAPPEGKESPAPPIPTRTAIEVPAIRGHLRLADGSGPPPPGIEVILRYTPPAFTEVPFMAEMGFGRSSRVDENPLAHATASDDGSFALHGDDLRGYLAVDSPFWRATEIVLAEAAVDAKAKTLELELGGGLAGVLIDPTGTPIVDQVVTLRGQTDVMAGLRQGTRLRIGRTRTNEKGEFFFNGAPAGVELVLKTEPQGFPPIHRNLSIEAGKLLDLELTAIKAARLLGLVIDGHGEPVANARVWARPSRISLRPGQLEQTDVRAEGETDESGRFELLGLPPGRYDLRVLADDYITGDVRAIELAADDLELPAAIVLETGERIRGVVVDDVGEPVPDAALGFSKATSIMGMDLGIRVPPDQVDELGGRVGHGEADGTFVSPPLPPGEYTISASADGHAIGALEDIATGSEDNRVVIERTGSIHGICISRRDGEPVRRFRIAAVRDFSLLDMGNFRPPSVDQIVSDDGKFVLRDLEPGEWRIEIDADAHGVESTPELEVIPGEGVRGVIVILPPEASIRGVVRNARSLEPIADARVSLDKPGILKSDHFARSVTTDEDGSFVLAGLAAGRHRLAVEATDYAPGSSERIALAEGRVIDDVAIDLEPGAVIYGRIGSADGAPEVGALVQAILLGSMLPAMTYSDENGDYEIRGLAAGSYTINKISGSMSLDSESMMSSIMEGLATRSVRLATAEELRVDFISGALGDIRVFGRVTEAGEPLDGALITFVKTGEEESTTMRIATSDDSGKYTVERLSPGDWNATIQLGILESSSSKRSFDFTLADVEESRQDFDLDATGIEGRVVAADTREPLGGIRVSVDAVDADVTIDAVSRAAGSKRVADVFTAEDGSFAARGLPPGRYQITAGGAGMFGIGGSTYCRPDPIEVVVRDGAVVSGVDLRLEPGGALTGRVTDVNDRPVPGATIFFPGKDGKASAHFGETLCDERGSFRAEGLRPDVYTVVVKAAGHATTFAHGVVVRAGEETERNLQIGEGFPLAVDVIDESGDPVGAANVRLYDPAGVELTAFVTIGDAFSSLNSLSPGHFELGEFATGTYRLVVTAGDTVISKQIQHGDQSPTITITLP